MSRQAQTPLVSISIVSHGDLALLQALLSSLTQHEQADCLQLILTDNLGTDLPEFDALPWHSLKILRNRQFQGFAKNHNTAFPIAQGKYFCIINPDVLFVQSVFQSLMKGLDSGQGDIAAPLVIDSDNNVQDSFRSLPSPRELFQRRALGRLSAPLIPAQPTILHPDWLAGIFLLMRRETYSRIGGFDQRYRLYFEDVDFCTRARLMGLIPFLDTSVKVQHDARRASRKDGRFLLWHMQSAMRFFRSDVYGRARKAVKG